LTFSTYADLFYDVMFLAQMSMNRWLCGCETEG